MAAKEKKEVNLPAYTTVDNMIKLIEAFRKKNNSEEESKPISGLNDNIFSVTKSALKLLGLIDGACGFTTLGRDFAFAVNLSEKQKIILDGMIACLPYENLLHTIFQKDVQETSVEEIVGYWGRHNYGTTERNRRDAAKLFGNFIEYVGMGNFIKGAQGNSSRIVWSNDAKRRFLDICETRTICETKLTEELTTEDDVNFIDNKGKDQGTQGQNQVIQGEKTEYTNAQVLPQSRIKAGPTIIVKVDMTNWEEEQIKNFFKYAYGQFDE